MATGQSTGAQVGPVLQVQVPAAARDRGRALAAFVTAFAGLVLVAIISTGHWWSILLWLLVGLVAGSIARQGRLVWITWLALVAYYPVATAVGVQGDHGPFWYLGAILGGLLLSVGFAVGSAIGRRADPWREARETWRRLGRVGRRGAAATVVAGIVAFSGYTAYVGLLGSDQIVHPTGKWTGCDTPASRFGWAYEAINYNPADDARLAAENPDSAHCRSQGEVAGNEVVSSDGVPIAGWYVPAASGMDSTGPTVVVVHGWKSNKSEALKYAVPFHDAFNVVLLDLRNGGRSGVADTTWGLREQLDVRAMIDWLERTKHPTWIAAMGNSMGGATILAEAATDVRVRALILDSMHAQSSVTFGNGLEVENGQPSLPGSWAMVAGVSFRIGADVTQVDPIRTIVEVGNRPVLLIHGTADALDRPTTSADLNFHAALAAGVPVQLEYCPGATHGAVIDHCPADWARWATSFLAGARAQT